VKQITKPMLGFKSFKAVKRVLSGIELMHVIRKGQSHFAGSEEMFFPNQFYALVGEVRSVLKRIQNLPKL
jgi:putative transposase